MNLPFELGQKAANVIARSNAPSVVRREIDRHLNEAFGDADQIQGDEVLRVFAEAVAVAPIIARHHPDGRLGPLSEACQSEIAAYRSGKLQLMDGADDGDDEGNVPMNTEMMKAHVAALSEWATQYERDASPVEGSTEVTFLMRRVARLLARMAGIPEPTPEPAPVEAPVSEARPDDEKPPVQG